MTEWRYSSTFLNLGTRVGVRVNFTARPFYPSVKASSDHKRGDCVNPRFSRPLERQNFLDSAGNDVTKVEYQQAS